MHPLIHLQISSSIHLNIHSPSIYLSLYSALPPSIHSPSCIQPAINTLLHRSIDPAIYPLPTCPSTHLPIHSTISSSIRSPAHPSAHPFLICSSLCVAEADSPLFWKNKSALSLLSLCCVGWHIPQMRPEAPWTHSVSVRGSSLPCPHLPPLILGRGGSQPPSGR